MVTLSIASDYLAFLIVRTRGVQARVGVTDPMPGSNPTDDRAIGEPLLGEFWAEGAERLGVDLPIEDIEERR